MDEKVKRLLTTILDRPDYQPQQRDAMIEGLISEHGADAASIRKVYDCFKGGQTAEQCLAEVEGGKVGEPKRGGIHKGMKKEGGSWQGALRIAAGYANDTRNGGRGGFAEVGQTFFHPDPRINVLMGVAGFGGYSQGQGVGLGVRFSLGYDWSNHLGPTVARNLVFLSPRASGGAGMAISTTDGHIEPLVSGGVGLELIRLFGRFGFSVEERWNYTLDQKSLEQVFSVMAEGYF